MTQAGEMLSPKANQGNQSGNPGLWTGVSSPSSILLPVEQVGLRRGGRLAHRGGPAQLEKIRFHP